MNKRGRYLALVISFALVFPMFGSSAFGEEASSKPSVESAHDSAGEIVQPSETDQPSKHEAAAPESVESQADADASAGPGKDSGVLGQEPSKDPDGIDGGRQSNLVENSWRYLNGKPREERAPWLYYRSGTPAWSWTPDGYVSSDGSIIKGAKLKGIDVSEHQGNINWDAVKSDGIDFAIIRCGYGNNDANQDDRYWLRNVSECERLGIPYGVYLYSYAKSVSEANSEADHVLRLLNGHHPAYPVYYDFEEDSMANVSNRGLLAEMAQTFCNKVSSAGYEPGIYANLNWWNNYLTDPVFNGWTRWVAQYNRQCDYQGNYHMWQATSSGRVNGIGGNVDLDFVIDTSENITDTHVVPSAPYPTSVPAGAYVISSMLNQSKVLDVAGGSMSNGGNVQLYGWNMTKAQRFELSADPATGYYVIKNVNSGLVLGLQKFGGLYTPNVVQYAPNPDDYSQKWMIKDNGSGSYAIVSAFNSSYTIDVTGASAQDGTNIQVYPANGTAAQTFSFNNVDAPAIQGERTLADGLYTLRSSLDSSKVVDIAGGSLVDGGNAQIYSSNNSAAQKYWITYDGQGFYTVKNLRSGKVLQSADGSFEPGTNVRQWESGSKRDDEKWAISKNADGTYTFVCKANGLAMDVTAGSTANGTNIQSWKKNGTPAQNFAAVSAVADRTLADGTYSIHSGVAPGMVVDIAGGGMGSGVNAQLYSSNGTDAQKFRLTYDAATGFYSIVNVKSGKPLDVAGALAVNFTNVAQYEDNGTLAQRWMIERSATGAYTVRSAIDPDYVLDVFAGSRSNGANIDLYSFNGTAAQRFFFESKVADRTLADGTYSIHSGVAPGMVVDIAGGGMGSGVNAQLYSSNGTDAQKFRLTYDAATGFYSIVNVKSGKPLDVARAVMADCTNVDQYEDNGTLAQRWEIERNDEGTYTVRSAINPDYVLDVFAGSRSNGANIDLYSSNGTAAQRFSFESA